MLARVTKWHGGSAEEIRSAAEEMRSNMALGPPQGVKTSGFMMLVDPDGGRVMMIGLFNSDADLNDSEPVLRAMNPPAGIGSRGETEVYEVAAEARISGAPNG